MNSRTSQFPSSTGKLADNPQVFYFNLNEHLPSDAEKGAISGLTNNGEFTLTYTKIKKYEDRG